MKKHILVFGLLLAVLGCKSTVNVPKVEQATSALETANTDFTIAFGSCNRSDKANLLWDDIANQNPNIWIWGGDIIYADTDDMSKLRAMYAAQKQVESYKQLAAKVPVIGTWDDHDYGLNDGGVEFTAKKESQQEFLDFMEVSKESPRRAQEGVYTTHQYTTPQGTVSVIILDTRYFRTSITPDTETSKRLKPNSYGDGTVLGAKQWQWLADELTNSNSDYNVIVSSIQVLSNEHGFECWGNFPHEVDRLKKLIAESKAKGVILLSGDRHISEFSKTKVEGLSYPLIDFTSSGLTHAYRKFTGEPNPFREGEVVFTESYGTVEFDFSEKKVRFAMRGDNNEILALLEQAY